MKKNYEMPSIDELEIKLEDMLVASSLFGDDESDDNTFKWDDSWFTD